MTTTYHGVGGRNTASAAMVLIERDGETVGTLRHLVRHSPTGLSWGYGGSGPADLARSLLVDVLGEQARCGTCAGTGRVIFEVGNDDPVPFDPANPDHADRSTNPDIGPLRCWDCDDGIAVLPYQDFKFDVIARLPVGGEWRLTDDEIRDWYTARTRI